MKTPLSNVILLFHSECTPKTNKCIVNIVYSSGNPSLLKVSEAYFEYIVFKDRI